MYTATYSKKVSNLKIEDIWVTWTNVNEWATWQPDLEYAKLEADFIEGKTLKLKPKGAPELLIDIVEVIPYSRFIDVTPFFGARMFDIHEIIKDGDDLEIRTTIKLKGPLSYIWKKLVVEDIVKGLAAQTEALIEKSRRF